MKRLSIILAYVLLSLAAVVATFSLLTLTSSTAYAHETSDDEDKSVNETRTAKPDGEVRIDNLAGTLKIHGWDKNEVRVTGNLGDQVDHLESPVTTPVSASAWCCPTTSTATTAASAPTSWSRCPPGVAWRPAP